MARLILVRHGITDFNIAHLVQGWSQEARLDEVGVAQAHALGSYLAKEYSEIKMVYSSDLLRAAQTAEIFRGYLPQANVNYDTRLREIKMGDWEGQKMEGDKKWEEYLNKLIEGIDFVPDAGNMESYDLCFNRVYEIFMEVSRYNGTVLVVSHEIPEQMMHAIALGCRDAEEFLKNYRNRRYLDNCSITEIHVENNHYSIVKLNFSPPGMPKAIADGKRNDV